MPALSQGVSLRVERARVPFREARDGLAPEGRKPASISLLERVEIREFLERIGGRVSADRGLDAMGAVTGNIPADDLRDLIQTAQSDLALADDADVMRRDPYRLILVGLSGILAVFGRSISRWERAVQDVIDARDPLPEADRQALRAELVTAVEDGAYRGMRKEAGRMVRTLDQRLAVQIGLSVCGTFVAGALSVLGVLVVAHLGPFSPAAERNAAWQTLIQTNPDPQPALASAEIRADQTGRRYYSNLSLWLDPAQPPPAR
jgi:hypothetical protein